MQRITLSKVGATDARNWATKKRSHKFIKECLGDIEVHVIFPRTVDNMQMGKCFTNCARKAAELGGTPALVWEIAHAKGCQYYNVTLHALLETKEGAYLEVTDFEQEGVEHIAFVKENRLSFDEFMSTRCSVASLRMRPCKSVRVWTEEDQRHFHEYQCMCWSGPRWVDFHDLLRTMRSPECL